MAGTSPVGGAPTAGSPHLAGSGDALIAGRSSASFTGSGVSSSGALVVTGGSTVSMVSAGARSGALTVTGGSTMSMVGRGSTTGALIVTGGSTMLMESAGSETTYTVEIDEDMTVGDLMGVKLLLQDGLTDGTTLSTTQPAVGFGLKLSSSMTFHGAASYVWTPGGVILEAMHVGDATSAKVYAHVLMTERFRIAQRQTLSMLASISEHFNLTSAFSAHIGTIILNRMLVKDSATAKMRYASALADGMRVASILARFTGATLTDGFTAHATTSATYRAVASITEFLTLALNQHYAMAFRISVADGVEIDDVSILKMIYQGTITEVIEIEVLYQSLGGNTTAWTVNTRTGAVTEYQGWNFNSFVQFGNKYVAASKDGLYELNGPTDDGAKVVADIMGGFLQPSGAHLAGLKGVYLGQTGQGYWLLKIDTGDGRAYVYQRLSNPGLMTTKFIIGKGINARYIGWELINVEGQDFDLDTIEFVPMVRARRI